MAGWWTARLLTIGSGLALSGGQVVGGTVNLPGGASMSGGTLHADTLNGRVVFNSGDLYGGDGLTVTLGPLVTGQIVTRGPFDADSDGSVVLGTPLRPANIYAGGDATLSISGNLSQRYGTVASNQSLTILATGADRSVAGCKPRRRDRLAARGRGRGDVRGGHRRAALRRRDQGGRATDRPDLRTRRARRRQAA